MVLIALQNEKRNIEDSGKERDERERGLKKAIWVLIFYITCFIYRKTILASRPGNTLKFKMSCFELIKFMHTQNESTLKKWHETLRQD